MLNEKLLEAYREHLLWEEKSPATVEKYVRDAAYFVGFAETLGHRDVSKSLTLAYKQHLIDEGYALRSINSKIASLNSLLSFCGNQDARLKSLKFQREIYAKEDRSLTRAEYLRLLEAAGNKSQLNLILQTICSTGIRISELKFFTVEAIQHGEVVVRCKNKTRIILVPRKLCKLLLGYAKDKQIDRGMLFRTRNGNPLDRSNIWSKMKQLCTAAGVNPSKVFPHNLRKLFARTFYNIEKDMAKLADILGHASINTTRIYIMSTGQEHRRLIERMNLLRE